MAGLVVIVIYISLLIFFSVQSQSESLTEENKQKKVGNEAKFEKIFVQGKR